MYRDNKLVMYMLVCRIGCFFGGLAVGVWGVRDLPICMSAHVVLYVSIFFSIRN